MEALCYSMHEPKKLKRKIKKKNVKTKGGLDQELYLSLRKIIHCTIAFFPEENDLKMKERNGRKGR